MKITVALLLSVLAFNTSAQSIYSTISGGHSFKLGEQNLTSFNFNKYFALYNPTLMQKVDVSLGKGTNIDVGVGYHFKKNIGIELNTSYLFGGSTTAKSEYATGNVITRTLTSKMLRINPKVLITTANPSLNAFMSCGMLFGFGKINYIQRDDSGDMIVVLFNNELSGGWSFGIKSGIGIIYSMNRRFSIYGEVNFITMSYAPTEGKVIEFISFNEDKLDELKIGQKEVHYKDEIEVSTYDPNKPYEALKHSYPFGSYGLNFGIRFNFWNKSTELDN